MKTFDFVVIGAGIAGASVAALLAKSHRVALVEAEEHAGYHTTGRSAALYSEIYGNLVIRALTRASRSFFYDTPAGFSDTALVRQRDTLMFARHDQMEALREFQALPDIADAARFISAKEVSRRIPIFAPDYLAGAVLHTGSADIEVDALHRGFLRAFSKAGGTLRLKTVVSEIEYLDGSWYVRSAGGESLSAPVLINAAGAWADEIAKLAGLAPIGLEPLRRTAVLIDPPENAGDIDGWPAAIDIDEQFYFKPDAGLLLLSPADETLSPPCDAQPEDLDIAIAVDRFERATGKAVTRVRHSWAGLRSFVADRGPVAGFDERATGFFWLAGQGGYGIQTAPALARCAAELALGRDLPEDVSSLGIRKQDLAVTRLI
ncbi:FAD-binding oxidoreductase [Undibacterium sp.]|uniref:NAD(P)/FAD-dependent oxidoreductase n=1 Tax=Undibacterium sp. TaxID=1914977 RepID=UPI002C6F6CD8|nr:FAD-binding oxidoreductase [Undibacterium sp.]HTD04573.1 FAD-binding oxidoreductase [Undibacterium sp.]